MDTRHIFGLIVLGVGLVGCPEPQTLKLTLAFDDEGRANLQSGCRRPWLGRGESATPGTSGPTPTRAPEYRLDFLGDDSPPMSTTLGSTVAAGRATASSARAVRVTALDAASGAGPPPSVELRFAHSGRISATYRADRSAELEIHVPANAPGRCSRPARFVTAPGRLAITFEATNCVLSASAD